MDIEELIKELSFNEVKELLVDLAIHFSEKTKLVAVPRGTAYWAVEKENPTNNSLTTSKIIIPLIPFFGMFVGYNSEVDILVMWKM